jgi:hypothetical protein
VEVYGVGSYDPSKAPVMAYDKESNGTSASLKNGEFLASWVTTNIKVSKIILLTRLPTVSDLLLVPSPKRLRNPIFT